MSADTTWRDGYFESIYGTHADPYGVRSRWYEARKRALLLASLPRPRFRRAFEPACGVAELTAGLASRCDALLASDFNATALATARERTKNLANVLIARHVLPRDWPTSEAPFDLIVLSEIGYFLSEPELRQLAGQCAASLAADGALVACHWRRDFPQRTLSTELVHDLLGERLQGIVLHREHDFVLQVWSRDGESVAAKEGIR